MVISVPPSLKKIKVFLTRATELDRDVNNPESRVVAYNCRQYAVLQGIPLAGQDDAAKACLGELLGQLESEKAAMAVFSKSEHWKISRKVADRVFDKADSEDRGGVANKGTAKSFYAAGTFYEILQQFYEEKKEEDEIAGEDDGSKERREEEEQRRIYCKWKATEILNAIKEGRTPTPGGYQQEEETETSEEFPSLGPLDLSSNQNNGDLPSIGEDVLPPAPSMPSSDWFNDGGNNGETSTQYEASNEHDASNELQPPPYDGIELNLNGDPTPIVEDVNEDDEDSGIEEIFIPGAVKNDADNITNDMFVDTPTPPPVPPPSYADHTARSHNSNTFIPPPAASKPLPPPAEAPSASNNNNNTGMFSNIFGESSNSTKKLSSNIFGESSNSTKKLSKEHMADAVELTKFALAALQKGDGDLGKERLEQALGVWRSASSKKIGSVTSLFGKRSHSESKISDTIKHAKFALAALKKGDGNLGRERLEQALDFWSYYE